MPKSEYLQVYDYLNRKRPACFDRIRNEWLNDEDTVWVGSFERWLFEKVQEESEKQDDN